MPSSVQSAFICIISLISLYNPVKCELSYFRDEERWGSEQLLDLRVVTRQSVAERGFEPRQYLSDLPTPGSVMDQQSQGCALQCIATFPQSDVCHRLLLANDWVWHAWSWAMRDSSQGNFDSRFPLGLAEMFLELPCSLPPPSLPSSLSSALPSFLSSLFPSLSPS